LFSLRGRVPRRLYWATRGISILPFAGAVLVTMSEQAGQLGSEQVGILAMLMVPTYFLGLWIALAGSVKRWHDLDKSGWWIFIAMVPVIGGLWELILAGCTRGTRGPNRYGPEPT